MEKSRSASPSAVFGITAILAITITGAAIWKTSGGAEARIAKFGGQDADTTLVMPENGEPDMRFHERPVWESAQVPVAVRFDFPAGTENGGLVYNAQKFWAMNEKRGGHHTGDDLNGIGGMNTDLGDPVFAVADGLVVFAGESTPGWGNVVVVAHTGPDGKPLQSLYAHLDKIEVARGGLIARGGKVGTVGTANGYYPAHLHFEMRSGDGVDLGGGYANQPMDLLNPAETIGKLRNSKPDGLSPSPLAIQ